MFKYLIPILLLSLNAQANLVELYPLCYSRDSSCGMASAILSLPSKGNFRVRSRCRKKTPAEVKRGLCHKWNSVLQIQAYIKLPNIGQWVWRNQCFNNLIACKHAAEICRELNHKNLAF